MNIPRILALADLIEKQPHVNYPVDDKFVTGFSMGGFLHTCGTPSCIAGWAAAMKNDDKDPAHLNVRQIVKAENEFVDHTVEKIAAHYLKLDDYTADHLFMPNIEGKYADLTPAQAAATLRHLAATGEVKW